jgi:hypothetical protein
MILSACLRVAAVLSAITLLGSSLCRADDRLWAAMEGEYSGKLSGRASASLGFASTFPAGRTQEEDARMRAEFGGNPVGGVRCGQLRSPAQNDFARAMLTGRALVLLQVPRAAVAGPWVVQVHLLADDSGIETLYWATEPDGKQTKGWVARLRHK